MSNHIINVKVRRIAYLSFFVALSVLVNTLRVGHVSFGGFPIIASGYFLGPVWGFCVGFIADIVGFMIKPSPQGFNPVFAVTSGLTGFLPVYFTLLMGDVYPKYKFWKILISIALGQILTSVLIVPFFLNYFFKMNFYQRMIKAGIKQAYSIPVYAILLEGLIKGVSKTVDFGFFKNEKNQK